MLPDAALRVPAVSAEPRPVAAVEQSVHQSTPL